MNKFIDKLKSMVMEKIINYVVLGIVTSIVSSLLGYYLIIYSSFLFLTITAFAFAIILYIVFDLLDKKYHWSSKYKFLQSKSLRYIVPSLLVIILYFAVNFFIIESEKDYSKTNITFIQNLRGNKTAIIKNNGNFLMGKNPQRYHPYMGVISIGEIGGVDKRFFIEMEGVLKGESQIGIVLLKDGKMPTEYIELLASTTKDTIALNDVDGDKYNIESESVKIYEGKSFKLFMDYRKDENKACIYYNSIYSGLFNEKCVDLPNNLDIKFIGFKMVDDDVSNNNLSVPEINKFKVYALRF